MVVNFQYYVIPFYQFSEMSAQEMPRMSFNTCFTVLCRNSSWVCRQWRTFSSEEVEQIGFTMSKLTPLDSSNSSPLIEKYNTKGFTISGNKVYGSVALLPKAYFHWKVNIV